MQDGRHDKSEYEQLLHIIAEIQSSKSYKLASWISGVYRKIRRWLPVDALTKLVSKKRNLDPAVVQDFSESLPFKSSEVDFEKDVFIVAPAFFDKAGEKVVFGGAERYLYELYLIVKNLGLKVHVFQCASKDWSRQFQDMPVHGLACADSPEIFNRRFHHLVPTSALTIYHVFYLAYPHCHENSIGISHGVYWDTLKWQDNQGLKRPALRELLDCFSRLRTMVSVDTNTINFVRATRWDLADKFRYVANFVDLQQFKPRPPSTTRELHVLYPRRLYGPRGFHLMASVIPRLLKQDSRFHFHLIGQVESGWKQKLQEILSEFPNKVHWCEMPPERMHEAYQKADITVIPTVNSEGTSLSCLEAQASGNCVIATNVGGLSDLVIDEFNGLLIEPNAWALEQAILRLAGDQQLRERLIRNAFNVVQYFSMEKWHQRWRGIIQEHIQSSEKKIQKAA